MKKDIAVETPFWNSSHLCGKKKKKKYENEPTTSTQRFPLCYRTRKESLFPGQAYFFYYRHRDFFVARIRSKRRFNSCLISDEKVRRQQRRSIEIEIRPNIGENQASRITMCGMIEFQGDLFLLEIKLQKGKKRKGMKSWIRSVWRNDLKKCGSLNSKLTNFPTATFIASENRKE